MLEQDCAAFSSRLQMTQTCDAKLVMLPDKREEYAITMNSGLWGSASANPTLQEGWNLTSLDGKADSKTSETLNSLASFIKAIPTSGGASRELDGGGRKGQKGVTRVAGCEGLYRLNYDRNGNLVDMTYFRLPVRYAYIPPTDGGGAKKGQDNK
jgi:hypothetical protein